MAKAIAVSVITFFVSVNIVVSWNMPGIGILFAVVVMGGFIIASIEKKNK